MSLQCSPCHWEEGRLQWGRGWLGSTVKSPSASSLLAKSEIQTHSRSAQNSQGSGCTRLRAASNTRCCRSWQPCKCSTCTRGWAEPWPCLDRDTLTPEQPGMGEPVNSFRVKPGYSSSSRKRSHGPPRSAIHHQPQPGATQVGQEGDSSQHPLPTACWWEAPQPTNHPDHSTTE